MSVFLTRGNKAPYQQHVGFSLENYLSPATRAEMQTRIADTEEIPQSHNDKFESVLENDTVSVWGAQEKHVHIFEQMRSGDTALFIDTSEGSVAHLMEVSLVLGSEVDKNLRQDLSSHIWRDPGFEYLWFSTTPVERLEYSTDDLESLICKANPSFEFPSDWFSMGDDFYKLEAEILSDLGGETEFLEELRSHGRTKISDETENHLIVDLSNIKEQSHWTVAAKFNGETNLDQSSDDFQRYKQGDDPRIQYHLLERTSDAANRISNCENDANVLIRKKDKVIKQGRLGSVEGKRIDGNTYDLVTIFEVRDIPPIPVTEILDRNRSRPLDPVGADLISLTESEYERYLIEVHGNELSAGVRALSRKESMQSQLYQDAAAHLVAGRSVVFYGPPGTGKTRAAQELSKALRIGLDNSTANAEWTNYDVVGGYKPAGPDTAGEWEPSAGFLASAAQTSKQTLRETGLPQWLLIDEINRANLDQAFGDVFTLLDIDYRTEQPIQFGDNDLILPLSFRILATMNTSDRAKLFSLGYAFRRRFAFVRVGSLLTERDDLNYDTVDGEGREIHVPNRSALRDIIQDAVENNLTRTRLLPDDWDTAQVPHRDAATIDPGLALPPVVSRALVDIVESIDFGWSDRDPLDVTLEFIRLLTSQEQDIIEIGHAIAIDVTRYLVAAQLLSDDDIDRSVVDRALVAYLLPQVDAFMSELRKEETIKVGSSGDDRHPPSERYQNVKNWASDMGLNLLASELDAAEESYSVI